MQDSERAYYSPGGYRKLRRSEKFEDWCTEYPTGKAQARLKEHLSKPRWTVQDTDISYRVINHWASHGLIDGVRRQEKGWRKFNDFELLWINIIDELRKYGLSLEQIKNTKDSLFNRSQNAPRQLFESYVSYGVLFQPQDDDNPQHLSDWVTLLIFHDGWCEPLTEGEIRHNQDPLRFQQSYVSLSMLQLLEHIELEPFQGLEPSRMHILNKSEQRMLTLIREGKFEQVTARLSGGDIVMLESELISIPNRDRIEHAIESGGYEDITISKEKGVPQKIKRVFKEKL